MQSMLNSEKKGNWLVFAEQLHFRVITSEYSIENRAMCFVAQVSLPDDDFLELAERGYDPQQIARALKSDINLVALKADTLISQGYRLRQQDHCSEFLRYDK